MQGFPRYFLPACAAVAACVAAVSCRKPTEAAKSELETAGYQITTEDWLRAAGENQTEVLRKFVSSGFDPRTRDAAGNTALHAAAARGAKEAAAYLLDKGLEADAPGANGRTPLMDATLAGQPAMTAWLIRQGADAAKKDADGFSSLMLAIRENKPRVLSEIALHDKAELDAGLLVASITGSKDCIDVLTSYGASVYARMDDGRTPLMLAAENGRGDAAALLLELGASRFSTDEQGRTAADIAIAAGHPEIAGLIHRGPDAAVIALESAEGTGEEMNATLAREVQALRGGGEIPSTEDAAVAEIRANQASRPLPISGETVGKSVPPAHDPGVPSGEKAAPLPPLVMRHYRERELPVILAGVSGETATFRVSGSAAREIRVATGGTIPGTSLSLVRAHRRMERSKVSPDATEEISVVTVRDTATGQTREWTAGRPATAHDPVALVEDATTGKRYTATIGQRFHDEDGNEFIVTDVRPGQIVIEDATTGATQTLPLRGTRG